MNEPLKPTDLDYLVSDHHLQMIKAALPYMEVREQMTLSLIVKASELQNTARLFHENEGGMVGICSAEPSGLTTVNMLSSIRTYANSKEQEFIDLLTNFLQQKEGFSTFDMLKRMMPEEQQKHFDTIQLLMQTILQSA